MKKKHKNTPSKKKSITADKVYLDVLSLPGQYVPINLNLTREINFKRALELEQFRIEHQETFEKLSKTEIKVMQLLAEGLDQNELADALFISPNTVRTHRNNLYKKLEISRFSDLVYYARAFDLI